MTSNGTVGFFDAQFRNQVATRQFALNPFEEAVLPHLSGRVLDLGCGLGNLSIAAARRGCDVLAVDASPAAIDHLARVARDEQLPLTPVQADAGRFEIPGHCLFAPNELDRAFEDWTIVLSRRDDFPAAGGAVKSFSTVLARRPSGP